jgi:twitching motility protein PilU
MQATPHTLIYELLQILLQKKGTDLYLTVKSKPIMRTEDEHMQPISEVVLDTSMLRAMALELIGQDALNDFETTLEYNTSYRWENKGRFRINVFRQQQDLGMVFRRIRTDIPSISELALPKPYAELAMEKRGLVLIAGATGAGKSTSMAAMLHHRNERMDGHIVTVEDPV